jgi:Zn-dependent peptidase ImmA (M78 family)
MTMTSENPMNTLYERLSEAGLTRHYVKQRVLPDWWDDRAARNPVGYQEGLGYISKHTGIALEELKGDGPITFGEGRHVRFKKRDGVSHEELTWAKTLAGRAAEMAAFAMNKEGRAVQLPGAWANTRASILANHPWVDFERLLDFCWDAGIPVLHVSHFPKGSKKMAGMAAMVNGRPVLIISKQHKHDAWLSFICAHELGHVACGHLSDEEALADAQVNPAASGTGSMEQAANDFAAGLIAAGERFEAPQFPKAEALAEGARATAEECRVAPGVIVLNYVYHVSAETGKNYYPLANKTLDLLYPDASGAHEKVKQKMTERLPLYHLPDESTSFFLRLTGAESQRPAQTAEVA